MTSERSGSCSSGTGGSCAYTAIGCSAPSRRPRTTQDTFLRAWRRLDTFQGRATFRAWLYRIATNTCLDTLGKRPREPIPEARSLPADPTAAPLPAVALRWVGPFPDRLLEPPAPSDSGPDAVAVSRETVELAFIVAVQHLPPRQRAVLILRDVLGWRAKEVAVLLESSVAATNSALQRARVTVQRHLPRRRVEWSPTRRPSEQERAVVRRYMDALARADDAVIGAMLREDARCSHQPGAGGHMDSAPVWYEGRDTLVAAWSPALRGPDAIEFRFRETRANGHPAIAVYMRPAGSDSAFEAFVLSALRIVHGRIAELTGFTSAVFPAFELPATLAPDSP
ncbi:RNA polymerase subunit sigma-70 [Amycolatopsis cihanbeyliensis]|uniref:RNA polymerase subunit sigma-70 n=1 Tax=Amycolatopsis cihanbeyliensis TaxID=1128664 RepID=UPI00319E8F41